MDQTTAVDGTVEHPHADDFEHARALPEDRTWFENAVFYEVLVRAFRDSNSDGIGDLRGLTERLDYLKWLGVDCLWLPPFYDSPLRDGGYDIRDFYKVLAYVRELEVHGVTDSVRCVNNPSRFPQPIELKLQQWIGYTPVEMTGHVDFPSVGQLPYLLTLPGHGFYWFALRAPVGGTAHDQGGPP